jgi:hypothetical protein
MSENISNNNPNPTDEDLTNGDKNTADEDVLAILESQHNEIDDSETATR